MSDGAVHVYPLDDFFQHELHQMCLCGPLVSEGGKLVTHRSLDGREFAEHDYDGPPMPIEPSPHQRRNKNG